jgi:hypothetical protein
LLLVVKPISSSLVDIYTYVERIDGPK